MIRRRKHTNVHNLLRLDDGELSVASHDAVVVVRGIPEHQVPDLVGLPSVDERDIAGDGRLHDESPTVEDASFLRVTGNPDASLHTTRVVTDRDSAGFNSGVRAGWREDARFAGRVRVKAGNKSTLRDQLNADIAVEVS